MRLRIIWHSLMNFGLSSRRKSSKSSLRVRRTYPLFPGVSMSPPLEPRDFKMLPMETSKLRISLVFMELPQIRNGILLAQNLDDVDDLAHVIERTKIANAESKLSRR